MVITRYRFIAWFPGHDSMEAEVKDGDKIYYVNIDVNSNGKPTEILDDSWESYSKPLDQVDCNTQADVVSDPDFSDVLRLMVNKWNVNPIFATPHGYKSLWRQWNYSDKAYAESFSNPKVTGETVEYTGGGTNYLTYQIAAEENGRPSVLYGTYDPNGMTVRFMRAMLTETTPTFGDEDWCDVPGCLAAEPDFAGICVELAKRANDMYNGKYERKYPTIRNKYDAGTCMCKTATGSVIAEDVFEIIREGKTIIYGHRTDNDTEEFDYTKIGECEVIPLS